jgi:DNA helicase-2/ATP-dependent DNA helicase PcrA
MTIAMLPGDHLIPSIALDLFHNPGDLALAHKLASVVAVESSLHPDWRLPDFSTELITFITRERKMKSFDFVEEPFDPQNYKGKVLLTTIHKSKGLEWDKVYLTSLNNYDFPSGSAGDPYISEKWFIKGKLNLQAEALAMLDYLAQNGEKAPPRMGEATFESHKRTAAGGALPGGASKAVLPERDGSVFDTV